MSRLNQYRLTQQLVTWLKGNPWKSDLRVRYDGSKSSPYTPDAEHCSLYIGEKKQDKGRRTQIAQVDILVEGPNKTVELLVEIEPDHSPKKVLGDVLPVLLAENFTPSKLYGAENQRLIKQAVFLFVTVVPDKGGSQKRTQLDQLERAIHSRMDFSKLPMRTVRFCVGDSEASALNRFKEVVQEEFGATSQSEP
jgi:hypothetical protein